MSNTTVLFVFALVLAAVAAYGFRSERRVRRLASERDGLLAERDRVEDYLEIVGAMIVMLDPQGRIVRANKACLEMLGASLEQVRDEDWYETFVPGDTRESIRSRFDSLMSGGEGDQAYAEYSLVNAAGDERHTIWYRRVLREPTGRVTGLLSAGIDDTDRKREEDMLSELARHDDLTHLHNRRGFYEMASQQLKLADRTDRLAYVILADIDNLKTINDTFGHAAGDLALVKAADLLRSTFRASDVIGRIGGDEFAALVLVRTDMDLEPLRERLGTTLSARLDPNQDPFSIRLSVGIAQAEPSGAIPQILEMADQAMYREKKSGRADTPTYYS